MKKKTWHLTRLYNNRHNFMFSRYNSVTVMKLCKKKYEMKNKTWHLTRLYIIDKMA